MRHSKSRSNDTINLIPFCRDCYCLGSACFRLRSPASMSNLSSSPRLQAVGEIGEGRFAVCSTRILGVVIASRPPAIPRRAA